MIRHYKVPYATDELTLGQLQRLLSDARQKCYEWWVDKLDVAESFRRQKLSPDQWEDKAKELAELKGDYYYTFIRRMSDLADIPDFFEVCVSAAVAPDEPTFHLWVLLKPEDGEALVEKYKLRITFDPRKT